MDGESLAQGGVYSVGPGAVFSVDVLATNEGNLVDDLDLQVSYNLTPIGEDGSLGWSLNASSADEVGVNESVSLMINATIPADAWNGSLMHVSVSAQAQGEDMGSFSFDLEVSRVPGWAVYANQANLEIDPSGSQVQLTVAQMGNCLLYTSPSPRD